MTENRRWPDAGEYAQAARDPVSFLVDEEMQSGKLRTSPLGIPLPATGRNAAVFRLMVTDGADVAVRCFTRAPREGRRRYDALRAYVERTAVPAFAHAEWLPNAVVVDGDYFPMLSMEWVEGLNLDRYIEAHIDDPRRLIELGTAWVDLLFDLEASDVAHGDLQHGNVLVEADGRIRLVDLDGVWTPATTDLVPNEVGHRNYQHPQRISDGYWGRSVDAFSALVIALTLEAVSQRPNLWLDHNDGANNLIFAEADFLEPGATAVWNDLAPLEEPVPTMAQRLVEACEVDVARLARPTELVRRHGRVTTPAPPSFLVERAIAETDDPGRSDPEPHPVSAEPNSTSPSRTVLAPPAPESRIDGPTSPERPRLRRSLQLSGAAFVLLTTLVAIVAVFVGVALLGVLVPAGLLR